jgi:Aconitase family (aconitate hydratase)
LDVISVFSFLVHLLLPRVALAGFSSISDRESIVNHALVPACVFLRELGIHLLVGLATIANMGAEVGATTSTFPYTPNMQAYLHATRRGPVARAADEAATKGFLSADVGAEYDELIEIVSALSRLFLFPPSKLTSTGSVDHRAHNQRAFHSRFGNALVQIRIICEGKRLAGQNICEPDWLLHE